MATAGQIIRAADFPGAGVSTQNTSGTTTSTSYTATLTGGTACSVVFVAPTSGKVVVHNACLLDNSGANDSYCGWIMRTGGTVGSGGTQVAASDANALLHNGTAAERQGMSMVVTGLTAGATYHVQQMFRVTNGTGTFLNKTLSVTPTT